MTGDDARRPRLLYVEDDGEISAMTIEVLNEVYDVAHESDGLRARDRALQERFDLLVLDRRLPHLDGERWWRRSCRQDGGPLPDGAKNPASWVIP
jgi:DNA-binding response OmpR family regulator